MKKLLLFLAAGLIIIILLIVFLVYLKENSQTITKENKTKVNKIELKKEYLEWFNSTSKAYDFNHPYVKCIFEKTCNGSFDILLYSNSNNPEILINNSLKKFGYIEYIRKIGNYSILLKIKNLESINNFINSPLFYDVNLINVYSDYKINVSEKDLIYCDKDSDCFRASANCCSGSNCGYRSINKKYSEIWETQFYSCRFIGCIAVACFFKKLPACINYQCDFIRLDNCQRDEDCIFTDEINCINKEALNRFNYTISNLKNLGCECKDSKCVEVFKDNKIENISEPLIININQPINNSKIAYNNTYLLVSTNKKAVCFYQEKVSYKNIENNSNFKLMNITNGTFHSQFLENLIDGGNYLITLNCTDDSGNSRIGFVEFLVRNIMPLEYYIFSNLLTSTELLNLLADGVFEHPDAGTNIQYTQSLSGRSLNIENNANEGILIRVGTNPNNYLYKYKLAFMKNINFTAMENTGAIKILGEDYEIERGSFTSQKIILRKIGSNINITLEHNQSIKINDNNIVGTFVKFNEFRETPDYVAMVDIYFVMQDSNKDYIAVREYFDDPVFQNIRVTFKSYSIEKGAEVYIGSVK